MSLERLNEIEDWDGSDNMKLTDLKKGSTKEARAVVTEMASRMKIKIDQSEMEANDLNSKYLPDDDMLEDMWHDWTKPLKAILDDEMGDIALKDIVKPAIENVAKEYWDKIHEKWGINGGGENKTEMPCGNNADSGNKKRKFGACM